MYQFDNFLRYVNLNITSPAKVENAIQLHVFGSCMHKEARSYFETNIGPTPTNEEGQRTIAEWDKIKENFIEKKR